MNKVILVFTMLLGCTAWLGAQLPPPCPSNFTPPADNCPDACIYCNFNGISSNTSNYSGGSAPGWCGSIENEQWLGFIAGASGCTFVATATGCTDGNGIQIGLYESCGSGPIACDGGSSGGAAAPVTISAGLVPGQNYFLCVDGFAGDQCSFNISVDPPSCVAAPPVGPVGIISGPTNLCPGAEVVYTINPVVGAGGYTWTAPPGSLINGQAPPLQIDAVDGGTQVTVTIGPTGGQICVRAANSCFNGPQTCKTVIVQPIPPTNLSPVTICAEDAPYTTPWGADVMASGLYSTTLDSWLGCDSLVRQNVTIKAPIIRALPPQTLCAGESITVCNQTIDQQGPFSVTCDSWQGCDSTVNGLLQVFDPVAEILNGGTISCTNTSVTLNAQPNQYVKLWQNSNGQTIGNGNSVTVNQPGTYVLLVTATSGPVTCTAMDTVTVIANNIPPQVSVTGGTLGCSNNTVTLGAQTSSPGVNFAWTGPNGFTSNAQAPTVTSPGSYVLTLTNPANGCSSTATATVDGNTTPPQGTTTGGTLTCSATSVGIGVSANVPNATFNWSGPNGFANSTANPNVTAQGNYIVTITNPTNGCTSTSTAIVSLNNTAPGATAQGGTISCASPNIDLNGNTGAQNPTFAWGGPNGFASNVQNPSASTVGTYTVTVTSGVNGCTSTATATVDGNTTPPGATATGGTLTCAVTAINLVGGTTSGTSYAWTGPNGFTSSQQNPIAQAPGMYTLVTTAANQCTSTASVTVDQNIAAPTASANGGTISCSASSVTITGSSTTPGATYTWEGPGNYQSNLQNPNVTNTGNYTLIVTGPNGCTTTASATVNPDANVPQVSVSGGTIDCNTSSIQISGSSATVGTSLAWSGPNNFTSTSGSPTVTTPGNYILTVTNPGNGCSAIATALVDEDKTAPDATLNGGMITCTEPDFEIISTNISQGATFVWSGPNAFASTLQNPTVSTPGTYTAVLTGPNGCTASKTVAITADQNIPVAQVTGGTLTCAVTSLQIEGSANLTVTFQWNGPGGFDSPQANPNVDLPGNYVLTITAGNGCTATATAVVAQDIAAPNSNAVGGTIDCNNSTVALAATSTTTGASYLWSGPNNYSSTTQNPTVSTSGDYTLIVTGPNGCTSEKMAVVDLDVTPPTVDAIAADILTCAQTSISIDGTVNSTASPLATISWAGPAAYNSTDEDPTVSQPGLYTLTATSENGCTSTASVDVMRDITEPNVSALGGTLTCVVTSVVLSGNSSTQDPIYTWSGPGGFSSNDQNPSVSAAGVYTLVVTGTNGCTNASTVNVNLDGAFPQANATASIVNLTCSNPATTLNGTSTTPGTTFTWSGPNNFSASGASVSNIADPGTYNLAVLATNGCVTNFPIEITQDIAAPDISATGATIDCISGMAQITGNSATVGATYNWSGPANYTSSQASPNNITVDGPYTLVVTGLNGCTSSTTVDVLKNTDAPQVAIAYGGSGESILTCVVDSVILIGSTTTPGATVLWTGPNNTSSTDLTFYVTSPGQATFTVTAPNGCKSNPAITIPVDVTPPIITATPNAHLDCNNTAATLTTTVDINDAVFLWDGPTGPVFQPTLGTSQPGTYNLTVTDQSNGCTAIAQSIVTQDIAEPTTTVDVPVITCKTPVVTLDAECVLPNVIFEWMGPNYDSEEEDPVVDEEGEYYLTVTAANGCTFTVDVELAQNMQLPNATASGVTLTCTQPTGTINATSSTPNVSFAWSGPGGFTSSQASPTVSATGTYTVVVTDEENGCTSSRTAEVLPDASIPQVQAQGGLLTCKILDIQLSASSTNPNVTWAWSGPNGFTSTEQNPTITVPGNYSVTATAQNGCKGNTGVTVESNTAGPQINTATPDKLDCTTTQVNLNASVPVAGNYSYAWVTANGVILSGQNTQSPIVSQAGIYTVQVTDEENGCTNEKDVEVEVDPATPSGVVAQADPVSCFGDTDGSIFVESVVGGTQPFLYSLNNQPFSPNTNFTFLPPGQHSLKIQDANGCEYETVLNIDEPEQLVVTLGPDTTLHLGQTLDLTLDNFVNLPDRIDLTDPSSVNINPASFKDVLCDTCNHTFFPLYTANYTVTVVDTNGCKASDTRLIIVDKTRLVFIPNIIDPSSNNNNIFTVFGGEGTVRVKVLEVYDRWGEAIHHYEDFAPNDLNAGWRGEYRGKEDHSAVFVYYAEVEFLDGEVKVYKGDVTVIRN